VRATCQKDQRLLDQTSAVIYALVENITSTSSSPFDVTYKVCILVTSVLKAHQGFFQNGEHIVLCPNLVLLRSENEGDLESKKMALSSQKPLSIQLKNPTTVSLQKPLLNHYGKTTPSPQQSTLHLDCTTVPFRLGPSISLEPQKKYMFFLQGNTTDSLQCLQALKLPSMKADMIYKCFGCEF
ncbi:hypothetical protein OTU49_017412, partial [Cherax quadricarinatus]